VKDEKGRVLFCIEDNLEDGKSISTVSSPYQNLIKQHQSVKRHITSTETLIGGQFKKLITPSTR